MPDPAMINAYIKSRGGAMSADNSNRVRQHFASNPDLLDRKAMGLPAGLEDGLDVLLDKQLEQSMPSIAKEELAPPASSIPPPSKTGPRIKGPGEVGGTSFKPQEGEGSPLQKGGIPGDANAPGGVTGDAGSGSGDFSKWLLALLGASSAGVGAAAGKRGGLPAPVTGPEAEYAGRVPQTGGVSDVIDLNQGTLPKGAQAALEGQRARLGTRVGPNMESVGGEIDTINNRNASFKTGRERMLQGEVDAENDLLMRQMKDQERARRAQAGTKEVIGAAKRAVGRK